MYDECCEKFDTHSCEHHESCRYVLFFIKTYLYKMRWDEMRWDPLSTHYQGNQSRNGFVHQTVALVEKAMLTESDR